jgi:hypothetical protein
MKSNPVPKSALLLLSLGLFLTAIVPIIARYWFIPGFAKGLANGLGLMLEVMGIIQIQQSRKRGKCGIVNNIKAEKV